MESGCKSGTDDLSKRKPQLDFLMLVVTCEKEPILCVRYSKSSGSEH